MYFGNVIQAVGHTPLVALERTSPNMKVKIFAKLEGQNTGGSASIKDRMAKYVIEKAEQSGELTKGKNIVEVTSGNTGIALAWLGRMKDYEVTIIMGDDMSVERQQLIRLFGAELILAKHEEGVEAAFDKARELVAIDSKYIWLDQFSNPANPLAHYETTGPEIIKDFPNDKIDVFIAGSGTGGTVAGTGRRLKEKFPEIKIFSVEPPSGDTIQGCKSMDELEQYPPFLDLSLVTERSIVNSEQANTATRQLLENEGIFAGQSSGATVHQAIKVAREMD
ncbi:PLP-dependent cysteine synthase family protein [Chloroflexota bacterium]